MDIFSEEIFGPVAPIFKLSNEQEATEMANDTEFGLASYVFTNNIYVKHLNFKCLVIYSS